MSRKSQHALKSRTRSRASQRLASSRRWSVRDVLYRRQARRARQAMTSAIAVASVIGVTVFFAAGCGLI